MEEKSMPNPHQKTTDFSIASWITFSTILVAKRDSLSGSFLEVFEENLEELLGGLEGMEVLWRS